MEIKRKLASVRIIKDILPIEDADFIELAIVDGWQCVVRKGELKKGDKVIYFEIDSFLPIRPEFEFLRKSSFKRIEELDKEGFRLRTMKFKDRISQGLALSFSKLNLNENDFNVGDDLTDLLSVEKYVKPIPIFMSGKIKGYFPGFISKTDQERIQNLPHYFEKYKNEFFEVTIKLDGTSSTYFYRDGEFGCCSSELYLDDLSEDNEYNIYIKISKELYLKEILSEFKNNIALQGEIIGRKIQKNRERLAENELYIFNIYDIDRGMYMEPSKRYDYLEMLNCLASKYNVKIKHVPILSKNERIFKKYDTIDKLLEYADGPSLNPNNRREGIVCKSVNESKERISFKVINNKYLLRNTD
jgi:RNA ligase (TIGR02306 family)